MPCPNEWLTFMMTFALFIPHRVETKPQFKKPTNIFFLTTDWTDHTNKPGAR